MGPRVGLQVFGEEKNTSCSCRDFNLGSDPPVRLRLRYFGSSYHDVLSVFTRSFGLLCTFYAKYLTLDRAIPKIYAHRAALFLYYAFILCPSYHLCFKELNVLRAVELRLSAALDTRTSAKYCYAPERCRVSSGNFLIIRSAQSFSCTPT